MCEDRDKQLELAVQGDAGRVSRKQTKVRGPERAFLHSLCTVLLMWLAAYHPGETHLRAQLEELRKRVS